MRQFFTKYTEDRVCEGVDFSKSTSLTQQEFKDSCDINEMVRRALIGDISVLRRGEYADMRNFPTDSHEMANIVANANTAWHDMPDTVKATFGSVEKFMTYLLTPPSDSNTEVNTEVKTEVKTETASSSVSPAPSNT